MLSGSVGSVMATHLTNAVQRKEVQTLDSVRRTPAKAQLESPSESTPIQDCLLDRLGRTVESALTDAHGSQKAAAIEIDVDQSQLKRQLRLGTFDLRQHAAAGELFLAKLGEALLEEFGTARKSKAEIARDRLPELFATILDAISEREAK